MVSRTGALSWALAITAVSCAVSFPDYPLSQTSTTGTTSLGGGGSGGSGGSSTGGHGGSSTSSGTSSSGASCDVLHVGGGPCEFLPGHECGCPANEKCSVADETGKSACVVAGSQADFTHCATDSDCAAGSYCNLNTKACQPFCANSSDCLDSGGGQCLPVFQANGTTPIPGVSVCAAHCDLVTGMPCGAGLNCIYEDTPKEFDCVVSKGLLESSTCAKDSDCALTLGCFLVSGSSSCKRWCSPASTGGTANADGCSVGEYCYGFNPPIEKDGTITYGSCDF